MCLPFGLHSAPILFIVMADLLAWIFQQQGISELLHCLHDFLTIGHSSSYICQQNLSTMWPTQSDIRQQNLSTIQRVCTQPGVPLAIEMVVGPTISLSFLGISSLRTSLPEYTTQLTPDSTKRMQQKEVLLLVGLLQHAIIIVCSRKMFVSFMYVTATKLKEVDCFTRLNKEFHIHILHGGMSFYKAGTVLVVCSAVYLLHCQIAPYTQHI